MKKTSKENLYKINRVFTVKNKTIYECECIECSSIKLIRKDAFNQRMYSFCQCVKNQNYINKANIVHNNKYNYSLVKFNKLIDKVKILCPHHGEFIQGFHKHVNCKRGCPKCAIDGRAENKLSNSDDFIKKAILLYGNKYDYSKVEYKKSSLKVSIICKKHDKSFLQTPNKHLGGRLGCSSCSRISAGERRILEYLDSNKINYKREKSFAGCVSINNIRMRFDFYLPDHNLLIEYDGEQHFRPINFSRLCNSEQEFINRKKNDKIKNSWAKKNRYNLKRISYKEIENIPSILLSLLEIA